MGLPSRAVRTSASLPMRPVNRRVDAIHELSASGIQTLTRETSTASNDRQRRQRCLRRSSA